MPVLISKKINNKHSKLKIIYNSDEDYFMEYYFAKKLKINRILSIVILIALIYTINTKEISSSLYNTEYNVKTLALVVSPGAFDIIVENSFVYVSCGYNGISIYNISDFSNIVMIGHIDESSNSGNIGFAHQMTLVDNILYVGDGREGLRIVNVSDPSNPTVLGQYYSPNGPYGWTAKIKNNIAFLASGFMGSSKPGFQIINITQPTTPHLLSEIITKSDVTDLEIKNSFVFITTENAGFKVFDVSNLTSPIEIGSYMGTHNSDLIVGELTLRDNMAFLVNYEFEARILNISDLSNIKMITKFPYSSNSLFDIKVKNNLAYISAPDDGYAIFDIKNPNFPEKLFQFNVNSTVANRKPYRFFLDEKYIYLTYQDTYWEVSELQEVEVFSTTSESLNSESMSISETSVMTIQSSNDNKVGFSDLVITVIIIMSIRSIFRLLSKKNFKN